MRAWPADHGRIGRDRDGRDMKFGTFAPIPMAVVGSPEVAGSAAHALEPLPGGLRDAQYDFSLELLTAADRVGFDLVLFAERHYGQDLSAWVLASAIASRLDRMLALVAVHPGLIDPVMAAKMAVSVDRITRGRMAINIVNGWFDREFEMFGGKVLQGAQRYRRSTEFIEILRGLWTQETFSYQGEHYQLDRGQLLLKPATVQPPEIYSVSTSDEGRDFIANTCDVWFVEFPKQAQSTDEVLRALEASIADMDRRKAGTGRKIRYGLNPFLALGKSPEHALDRAMKQILASDPVGDTRKIESRMLPATRAGFIGTPSEVRKQVRRFADMGFDLLLLKMIASVEAVEEVGAEIIAHLGTGAKAAPEPISA